MAGPITWQNVAAPNFSDAFRGMATAQQGFDTAFTGLGDLIKKREATEAANYDQGKINNTNALLGAIQEAKTPEEFAAREAQLRQQLLGYGAQVDAAAARAALDGRLGTLQQRAVANQQFTDQQVDVAQRTPVAMFRTALLNAKTEEEANNIMAGAQGAFGNGVLSPSAATDLMEKGVARGQTIVTQDRAKEKFGFDRAAEADRVLMAPLQRAAAKAQTNASNAQAAESGVRGQVAQATLEEKRLAADAAKIKATFDARLKGTAYENGVFSGNDTQEMVDILSKNNAIDDGEKSHVLTYLAKLQADGGVNIPIPNSGGAVQKVPVPKDLLKSILAGARDEGWLHLWNNSPAAYVEKTLQEALNATDLSSDAENKIVSRNKFIDGLLELESARKSAIENPVVGGSSGQKSTKPYKPQRN